MEKSAVLERTRVRSTGADSEVKKDYWLLCSSCLWSETAYAGAYGLEWPAEVVLEHDRVYHRRCGGSIRVFGR